MDSTKAAPAGAVRRTFVLIAALVLVGVGLTTWKFALAGDADALAADAPEPAEVIEPVMAEMRPYRDHTTAIGTVVATRSVSLRNEVPGTVARVDLEPGRIVEQGALLVALDVDVERAELAAAEARAELAAATLERYERMAARQAASAIELDNVRAERDIALAEVARLRAVIARKTIRAPFRARVGIADVHPGQFLEAGSLLTTLQGVDEGVNVDFTVAQSVAAGLDAGDAVGVELDDATQVLARVAAVDARIDPTTRNAVVRARIANANEDVVPGSSVRVHVPVGVERPAVFVPASALRRGPAGDHVFVVEPDEAGDLRARERRVAVAAVLGREVVIEEGLAGGERVAASGSFKLRDGLLVHVEEDAAPGTDAAEDAVDGHAAAGPASADSAAAASEED